MSDIKPILEFKDIHVEVEGKEVVKGVSLTVNPGEIHAIMGKNGSGKSSLSNALMGHPAYTITKGEAYLKGESILEMEADQRSRAGLFLAFQYPLAIPGVTVANFMRAALKSHRGADADMSDFRKFFKAEMAELSIDESFATRYINDGFSGGEKKRIEILQMSMLNPAMALLDETDSGLDIDAIKIVSKGINKFQNDNNGVLMVTHYQRLLDFVKPHKIHVMMDGKFVLSGGPELAHKLEDSGYEWLNSEKTEV